MEKYIVIACLMFSFFCCAQKQKFESYSPAAFEKLLENDTTLQLVDVRRPDEYTAGHMDKAVLINVEGADFMHKADSLLDPSRPVAVYCRSGVRSKKAAQQLTKMGYKVYDLDKGYMGWLEYNKATGAPRGGK